MDQADPAETLALFETHRDPHAVAGSEGQEASMVKGAASLRFPVHEDAGAFTLVLDGRMELDPDEEEAARSGRAPPGRAPRRPCRRASRPRAEDAAQALPAARRGPPRVGGAPPASPEPHSPSRIVRSRTSEARRPAKVAEGGPE